MSAAVFQAAVNAMSNASTEPIRERDVASIITTGDGPGHLVPALFGDCSRETLDRIAAHLGRSPSQLVSAYRVAQREHGAANAEMDEA